MADYVRNHMFFALSTVVMLVFSVYVSSRLVFALDMAMWLKLVLTAIIVISSQSISFMRFLVTMMPGVAFNWLRVGGYVSALFMTLVSFTLIRDAILLGLWLAEGLGIDACGLLFSALNGPKVDAAMLLGSALFAAVGMWYALKVPGIKELDVNIPDLPVELDGLRLAQLTDLHIGSTFDAAWLTRVVENTNAMEPDIVLITGDLVDGKPEVLWADLAVLKNSSPRWARSSVSATMNTIRESCPGSPPGGKWA